MENQHWLDSVREQLVRHHLPPTYIQRFTEELGDHLEDLKADGSQTDASSQLGDARQVANTAIAAYRRQSFLGRHPLAAFLVFVISPVISFQFLFYGFMFLRVVFTGHHSVDFQQNHWTLSLMLLASSTFAGCLYGELAVWRTLSMHRRWMLVSCAVLAVYTGMLFSRQLASSMYSTQSNSAVLISLTVCVLLGLGQALIPLAIAWRFMRRKHDQEPLELAS